MGFRTASGKDVRVAQEESIQVVNALFGAECNESTTQLSNVYSWNITEMIVPGDTTTVLMWTPPAQPHEDNAEE